MIQAGNETISFFLIAGEPSGDVLGGRLMRAIREEAAGRGKNVRFQGIGGSHMQAGGLVSLFPMEDLSVMGVAEVLPALPVILKRLNQAVTAILDLQPDMLVTIDSPDFGLRVASRLHGKKKKTGRKIPLLVHYVAPTVWAWRPGRARKIAGFLDHLLALLPFEPPWFEKENLGCTFVGHPVIENMAGRGNGAAFRRDYGIPENAPVLCLLPGSRMSELQKLLPVFLHTAAGIQDSFPEMAVVLPTLPHLKPYIEAETENRRIKVIFPDPERKFDAFAAATAALAASGTVSLELALTGTPHAIAYRVSPVTAFLARRLLRTPWVNMVNILLKEEIVPEMLQDDCSVEALMPVMKNLLSDPGTRQRQTKAFSQVAVLLSPEDAGTPSEAAARTLFSLI